MRLIICGAGKVGLSIANYLEQYDNDIIIIEQSVELVQQISDRHDIQAIQGFASDPEVLKKAGAENADMIIAVTQSDEINMVACEVAHALFKIPTKIARIRNQAYLKPEWLHLFSEINICIDSVISPEIELARSIRRSLSVPGAFSIIYMGDDKVEVVGIKCVADTPIVNTPISHITSLFPDVNIRIVAIVRGNRCFVPHEKEAILNGDDIYFAAARDHVAVAMKAFGHYTQENRRILILGGGVVGMTLAQEIEGHTQGMSVRIIEKSKERAEFISRSLEGTYVLCGDALDSEVLIEAGVELTETVVAVTQDDNVNTLASLLAKRCGAGRSLCLINNHGSIPLVTSLGVDAVINPRAITVSTILNKVRRGHIIAVHTLREDFGELIEAEVHENSSLSGLKVSEIDSPGEIKVAAILRKDDAIIPTPSTIFQLDDRVIVMAVKSVIKDVERLFSARLDYF